MLNLWMFQQSSILNVSSEYTRYWLRKCKLRLFLKGYDNTQYSLPMPANAAKDAS